MPGTCKKKGPHKKNLAAIAITLMNNMDSVKISYPKTSESTAVIEYDCLS